MSGKFTHINESFTCEACGQLVPPATRSCRNHCPFCLVSKHVDHFPGDRANDCQGLLRPVRYEVTSKKGLVIIFHCEKCGAETRNIANLQDRNCPDDYQSILRLKGF